MKPRASSLAFLLFSLLPASLPAPLAAAPPFARFDESERVWSLGNASFEHVFSLTPTGRLVTLSLRTGSVERTSAALHSPEFALRVATPESLALGRSLELDGRSGWDLVSHAESVVDGGASIEVTLRSRTLPLRVTLHRLCYATDAAERAFLDVTNAGGGPLLLSAVDPLRLRVDAGPADAAAPLALWFENFTWGHPDTALTPHYETLDEGRRVDATTGPYADAAAWLAYRAGDRRRGVLLGWEWSGTGLLTAARGAEGDAAGVTLGAGLSPAFAHALAPGASFTSPVSFAALFVGSWDAAAHVTRRFVEARLALPPPFPEFPVVGFDSWGYGPDADETVIHRLVDEAADLGAEHFTLDSQWMARLGEWTPRPGFFDGGVRAIADHVHARGMRFGLWIALGSADPASAVLREHPAWRARRAGAPIVGDFGGHAICLADPDARAWTIAEVDRVVREYAVDWLLHDFQVITRCDDTGHTHQAGDGDWASTAGYYAVLDEIRRRHPNLVLENCWDGGYMLDFGMVARHHTTNLNDGNDALRNRQAVWGASHFLPPRYLQKYLDDDGTPDQYRFLSGIPGGSMLLMGKLTWWNGETKARARDAVALFKELRATRRDGRVRHVTRGPGAAGCDAWFSDDAGGNRAVLLVFRAGEDQPDCVVRPVGLDQDASYAVEELEGDGNLAGSDRLGGAALLTSGVRVVLPEAHDAAAVSFAKD